MVRQTSIAVYRKIEASSLLSRRRWEVYKWLFYHGPATGAQVVLGTGGTGGVSGQVISQNRARLTEMRDMGAVREMGLVKCPVTGNEVLLWDVTDQLPKLLHPVGKPTRRQLEDRITLLEGVLHKARERIRAQSAEIERLKKRGP